MQIIENKALLINTRTPDKYNIIPKSKVVFESNEGSSILIKWGLDEVRVLRNLGVRKAHFDPDLVDDP